MSVSVMSRDVENRVQRFLDFAPIDNDKSENLLRPPIGLPTNDRMKISRVIRAPDKRSGCDIDETFSPRDVPVIIELLRSDVFDNGQMVRSGTEILAHC